MWDYLGDEVANGPNCHWRAGPVDLLPRGDDEYALVHEGKATEETLRMRREGDALVVAYLDEFDDDRDGDVLETLENRLPVAAGLSSVDFTVCTDEQIDRWIEDLVADAPEGAFSDPARSRGVFGVDWIRLVR